MGCVSIYHYLLDERTGRCVSLGPRGRRADHEFVGPSIRSDGHSYRLPAHWLDLLMARFRTAHPDARVVDEADLEKWCGPRQAADPDADVLFEVGGDAITDIPLRAYLPEVDSDTFDLQSGTDRDRRADPRVQQDRRSAK